MEEQIKHKMADENQEIKLTKTNDLLEDIAEVMEDVSVVPPRFKFMEKQIMENKDKEKGMTEQQTQHGDESSSTEVPTNIMDNKVDSKKEEVMIEQQTERGDETSSTETPTTELPLPPRFKYMEKQFEQDRADIGRESTEIDAQKDAIVVTEITTGSYNDKDLVEDVTVGGNEYFEVFDIREDFNPGFHGIVKKKVIQKFSHEERLKALRELEEEEDDPPVVDVVEKELQKSSGWFSWLPFW